MSGVTKLLRDDAYYKQKTLVKLRDGNQGFAKSRAMAKAHAGEALLLQSLALATPDGSRTLFRNVSLRVAAGEHLLIMGVSGAGKSSLLRAIAGLWDRGGGLISRPPR